MLATGMALAILFSVLNPVFLSAPNLVDLLRNADRDRHFRNRGDDRAGPGGSTSPSPPSAPSRFTPPQASARLRPPPAHRGDLRHWHRHRGGARALNGLLIGLLGLPTLIVTLATLSLFRGALLTFVGTLYYGTIPAEMVAYSRQPLLAFHLASGRVVQLPHGLPQFRPGGGPRGPDPRLHHVRPQDLRARRLGGGGGADRHRRAARQARHLHARGRHRGPRGRHPRRR